MLEMKAKKGKKGNYIDKKKVLVPVEKETENIPDMNAPPFNHDISYFSTQEFRDLVLQYNSTHHVLKLSCQTSITTWRRLGQNNRDNQYEHPVVVNESAQILDGNHRLIADPNWALTVVSEHKWCLCPKCKIGRCFQIDEGNVGIRYLRCEKYGHWFMIHRHDIISLQVREKNLTKFHSG